MNFICRGKCIFLAILLAKLWLKTKETIFTNSLKEQFVMFKDYFGYNSALCWIDCIEKLFSYHVANVLFLRWIFKYTRTFYYIYIYIVTKRTCNIKYFAFLLFSTILLGPYKEELNFLNKILHQYRAYLYIPNVFLNLLNKFHFYMLPLFLKSGFTRTAVRTPIVLVFQVSPKR